MVQNVVSPKTSRGPQGSLSGGDSGPGSVARLSEFVIGAENQMTQVALDAILNGGDTHFNPVVFHGPAGVGKSHLAMGLAAAWKDRFRQRPALRLPALDFARELVDAIDAHAIEDFREGYRRVWLVVIEDIELLAGKDGAQRELAYLLDASVGTERRVVLTCATAPGQLAGLLPALQSRLISGLTVEMALPSPESRRAILAQQARSRTIALDDSVAWLLAEELCLPAAGLAGALMELELAARAAGDGITRERVREYLSARRTPSRATLPQIARATARHFSLKVADLRSASRRRAVVTARDVAMYLARTLTNNSLRQIGAYFDGRDHTTVSYGCWKTEKRLQTDPAIRDAVRTLRWSLEAGSSPRTRPETMRKTC